MKFFFPSLFYILLFSFFPLTAKAFTFETFNQNFATTSFTSGSYINQQIKFTENFSLSTLTIKVPSNTPCFTNPVCQLSLYHGATLDSFFNQSTTTTINSSSYIIFLSSNTGNSTTVSTANDYYVGNLGELYTSNNSSTYTNISGWDKLCLGTQPNNCTVGTQPKDAYINFNGFSSDGFQPVSIDWTGKPTSTCDFSTWALNLTGRWFDYDLPAVIVKYGISPNNLVYDDFSFAGSVSTQSSDTIDENAIYGGINKKTPLLPGFTFYAQAFFTYNKYPINPFDPEIIYLTSSTIWEFIIPNNLGEGSCAVTPLTYPNNTYPTSTPEYYSFLDTDWCSDWAESTITEQLKKASCQAGQFLFKPSKAVFQNFENLSLELQQKPPMGYFSLAKIAFTNIVETNSSTDTTTNQIIDTKIMTSIGNLWVLKFLKDWFIKPLLALAFLLYIYNRVKHLNFTE